MGGNLFLIMAKYKCIKSLAGYRDGKFFSHGQGDEVDLPAKDEYVRKGFYEKVPTKKAPKAKSK